MTLKKLAIFIKDSILGVILPSQYLHTVVGVTFKYLANSVLFFLFFKNKSLILSLIIFSNSSFFFVHIS